VGPAAGDAACAGAAGEAASWAEPRTGAKASSAAKAMPSERVFMTVIPDFGAIRPPHRRADRLREVFVGGRLAGFHIDHLNAAVGRIHRRVRILRLGLAVADGDEVRAV